ncbi:MAG: hypothetical protein UX37_C0019G0013 [Microgenomates group bacterium GW2011_GWA2_46_16]|nr:MAG: hypothetical protein UX37_C0019G0013 [Microgenomates group bacterium GW2011_GWA2_46_16]
MSENQSDEKLLTGPESHGFLSPSESYPLLTTEEFFARTSTDELKNIFGGAQEETLKPVPPPMETEVISKTVTPLQNKETSKHENVLLTQTQRGKVQRSVVRFFGELILMTLIIITVFYIWGAILLEN